jgi:23S rRNA (guanosine2251-2'-O)-methyltransferase
MDRGGPPPWARGPQPPTYAEQRPERPERATDIELVGEDEELVAGRHPVEEAFAARRQAVRLLVVPDRRAALDQLVIHATTLRIPVVEVEGGTLTSLTGFDGHQGVALVVAPRPAATVADILARAAERAEPPFVLVLDSLEDPQNLGTLLRSAEACGVHGVVFPTHRAAPLTPAAIKSAAGATEHLLLSPVTDLPGTLVDLRSAGLRLVGSDEGAPLRYGEADLRGPLALVVGSEARGISGALRRRLDLLVRIPMRGRVASLNAAVAGSVLLFAAADQRGIPEVGEAGAAEPPPRAADSEPVPAADQKPKRKSARKPRSAPRATPKAESAEEVDAGSGGESSGGSGADVTPVADDQHLPTDDAPAASDE